MIGVTLMQEVNIKCYCANRYRIAAARRWSFQLPPGPRLARALQAVLLKASAAVRRALQSASLPFLPPVRFIIDIYYWAGPLTWPVSQWVGMAQQFYQNLPTYDFVVFQDESGVCAPSVWTKPTCGTNS